MIRTILHAKTTIKTQWEHLLSKNPAFNDKDLLEMVEETIHNDGRNCVLLSYGSPHVPDDITILQANMLTDNG